MSKLIIQYFQNNTLLKCQNIVMTFSQIFPITLKQNYLLYAVSFLKLCLFPFYSKLSIH